MVRYLHEGSATLVAMFSVVFRHRKWQPMRGWSNRLPTGRCVCCAAATAAPLPLYTRVPVILIPRKTFRGYGLSYDACVGLCLEKLSRPSPRATTKGQDQRRGKYRSRKQEREDANRASRHIRDDAAVFQSASALMVEGVCHSAHPKWHVRHADRFDNRNPKSKVCSESACVLSSHKQIRMRLWFTSHRTDFCRRECPHSLRSEPVVTLADDV
jgi:hypothetical protein